MLSKLLKDILRYLDPDVKSTPSTNSDNRVMLDVSGTKDLLQFAAMAGLIAGKGSNAVRSKIQAIKFIRACTDLSLRDAKLFVDMLFEQIPLEMPVKRGAMTPAAYMQTFLCEHPQTFLCEHPVLIPEVPATKEE